MKLRTVLTLGLAMTFLPVTASAVFAKNKGGATAPKATTTKVDSNRVRKDQARKALKQLQQTKDAQ